MNKSSIFWKDDQLSVNIKLLTMFSAPLAVWISGLIYFCRGEIAILGREPLPINGTVLLLVILGAYFTAALWSSVIPRFTVWIERILLPLTIAANFMLLFPFPVDVTLKLFYAIVFSAHFSVIMYASIVSHLFTVATAWQSAALSVVIGGILHAVLQNDFFYIGFTVFIFASAIFLITATGFLYIIPGRIRVPLATWRDKIKVPLIAYAGIFALIFLSSMLSVYSVSFASRTYHGLTFLFVSAAVFSLITLLAWKFLESKSIKAFILYFVIIIAGIALAFLTDFIRNVFLFACIFLGASVSVAGTWTFLLSTAFSMHPTRFIGSLGTLFKAGAIALAAFLCDLFSENTVILIGIFGCAALLLTLTYIVLHKYFYYAFESHTLGTNIKLVGQPFSLPHRVQTSRERHPFDELADTELMVVKMLLEGHTLFSIAFNMSIDMETAKNYKQNIYKILGIHSKLGLFRIVQKQLYEF